MQSCLHLTESKSMIRYELLPDEELLIVMPEGQLAAEDFQGLAREVDPYLQRNGRLRGLMVHTKSFPGWENFAGLMAHLTFVKNHHRQIEKVAAVTDSNFLAVAPKIAGLFVQAKIRHFAYNDKPAALAWLSDPAAE